MIYDPILDTKLEVRNSNDFVGLPKTGCWYWFPTQEIAHMQKRKLEDSIKRFRYIGYPGTFQLPIYHSYFKQEIELAEETLVSWNCIDGRMRVNIDKKEFDITDRSILLAAGKHSLIIELDYTSSLPAVYLDLNGKSPEFDLFVSQNKIDYVVAQKCGATTKDSVDAMLIKEIEYEVTQEDLVLENETKVIEFPYYELAQVELDAIGDGEIEIVVGQSEEEALGQVEELEQLQNPPVKIEGKSTHVESTKQVFKYASFRVKGKLELKNIKCTMSVSPVEYKGEVETAQDRLKDYYYMGAASIHSCMHEFVLDAIYRDALPWALDGLSAVFAMDLVFGQHEMSRKTLISQVLPLHAGLSDLGTTYLDFQLYTLLGFENDYSNTKDVEFLTGFSKEIFHIADLYLELCDRSEKGLLSAVEIGFGSFFPDWSTNENVDLDIKGMLTYAQMMLVHNLEFVSKVAALVSDTEKESYYLKRANELRKTITSLCYCEKTGLYYNGYKTDGTLDERYSCYAQVFGVLFDFIKEENYPNAVEVLLNKKERHVSQSINYVWEMMSLAKMASKEGSLEMLSQIIDPIIACGDTRVYEDVRRDGLRTLDFYGRTYGKSLCHSVMGAAGVVGVVSGIMGLRKVIGEYQSYVFTNLANGLEAFSVKVPVKNGEISIYKTKEGCKLTLTGEATIQLAGYAYKEHETVITEMGEYELKEV